MMQCCDRHVRAIRFFNIRGTSPNPAGDTMERELRDAPREGSQLRPAAACTSAAIKVPDPNTRIPLGVPTGSQLIQSSSMLAIPTAVAKPAFQPLEKTRPKAPPAPPIPSDRIVGNYGPWQSLSDFNQLSEIGRGHLSIVWAAKCKDTGLTFAIKKYKKQMIVQGPMSDALKQNIQREVALLKSLRGISSICHLYGTFEDADGAYLVQEYCPGGDLLDVLKEFDGCVPEDILVPLMLAPLLKCLQRVHEKGIMHRALNWHEEEPTQRVGTLDYMAPEVLIHATRQGAKSSVPPTYTCKVDTWAVGILAYEMLTGAPPFEVASESNTAALILWTDVPVNGVWPTHLSYEAISFIKWALRKVADSRPSATEMLSHPWLTKYCPDLQPAAAPIKSIRTKPVQTASSGSFPSGTDAGRGTWPRNETMPNMLTPALARGDAEGTPGADDDPFESAPSSFQHGKSVPSMGSLGGAGGSPGSPPAGNMPRRHFGSVADMRSMQAQRAGMGAAGNSKTMMATQGAAEERNGMPIVVRSAAHMTLSQHQHVNSNKWLLDAEDSAHVGGRRGGGIGGGDASSVMSHGAFMTPEVGSWVSTGSKPDDITMYGAHGELFQFEGDAEGSDDEDDLLTGMAALLGKAAHLRPGGGKDDVTPFKEAAYKESPITPIKEAVKDVTPAKEALLGLLKEAVPVKKASAPPKETCLCPIAEAMIAKGRASYSHVSDLGGDNAGVRPLGQAPAADASRKAAPSIVSGNLNGREAGGVNGSEAGGVRSPVSDASKKGSGWNVSNSSVSSNAYGTRSAASEAARQLRRSGPGSLGSMDAGRPCPLELARAPCSPCSPFYQQQAPAGDFCQDYSPTGSGSRCILPALVKA
eukprot:jgi/Mesvir1/7602/Mv06334-RA.1